MEVNGIPGRRGQSFHSLVMSKNKGGGTVGSVRKAAMAHAS